MIAPLTRRDVYPEATVSSNVHRRTASAATWRALALGGVIALEVTMTVPRANYS
jgi:hypothetical protein